jgi:vesicle coat complex subunit
LIKKEAVKMVIANMTIGKDVSNLFADVLKCMQTDDLELKKLVYLYLMNYAKSQPELVILAVNSFCKDTEDPSPLLRALALRTMACIRLEKILDYLCEPLHRTLKDESPYVRKTAVLCVAKIFDLSPDLVEENGFLETLQGMLTDNNPMVISNVVSALADIQEAAPHIEALKLDSRSASKLIGALNECSEYHIFDSKK